MYVSGETAWLYDTNKKWKGNIFNVWQINLTCFETTHTRLWHLWNIRGWLKKKSCIGSAGQFNSLPPNLSKNQGLKKVFIFIVIYYMFLLTFQSLSWEDFQNHSNDSFCLKTSNRQLSPLERCSWVKTHFFVHQYQIKVCKRGRQQELKQKAAGSIMACPQMEHKIA